MSWANVIVAGASLAGGAIASSGAKSAASKQGAAAQQQLGLTRDIYNSQMAAQEPFRATGLGANSMLAQLYGLPYYDYSPTPQIGGGGTGSVTTGGSGYNKFSPLPGGGFGLDPLGDKLFGGGTKRTWGGTNLLTGKQVYKLAQQGMSVDDIAKLGLLQSSLNVDAIKNLQRAGLSVDDITRLQQGPQAPTGADGMPAGYHPGTGQGDLSVFQKSPGYQFRLNEGIKGIEQSAAARGGALSGNALRGVTEYGQNYASNEFGNFVNQLSQLSGRGAIATGQQQTAGTNYGIQAGNALGNLGDARASGVAGSTAGWLSGLGGVAQVAGNYMQNRQQPQYQVPTNPYASQYNFTMPSIYGWRSQ